MDQPTVEKSKLEGLWQRLTKERPTVAPKDWTDVKTDELNAIRSRRKQIGTNPTEGDAAELQLSALCLSGGGIRSAAFALGVIQALATKRLLKNFDYLSTVSGGGYTGSFLTAWVQRTNYLTVEKELDLTGPPKVFSPLSYLRRYSRYLTPHSGLLSADTLTVVALFTRNLLLNWMIILPFVIAAIILVKAGAMGVWLLDTWQMIERMPALLASIALALIGMSLVDSLRQRPGWETEDSKGLQFVQHEMIPLAAGSVVAMLAAATTLTKVDKFDWANLLWSVIGTGAAIGLTVWLVAFYFARDAKRRERETLSAPKRGSTQSQVATEPATRYVALTAAGITMMGVATGLVAALMIYAFPLLRPDSADLDLAIIVLTPPLSVTALFCGELVYTGMTSSTPWSDAEREWLARAAGYHGLVSGTYLIATGLVLFGSHFVFWLTTIAPVFGPKIIAAAGGVSGIVIAVLGKAPSTAALVEEKVNSWTATTYRVILACATPIFVASIVILVSWCFDQLMFGEGLSKDYFAKTIAPPPPVVDPLLPPQAPMKLGFATACAIGIAFLFALVGIVAANLININRFSLHNVYRNRLVRAFLGASHEGRSDTANSFTDLDDRDNIRLCEIWPNTPAPTEGEPLPNIPMPPPQLLVINMALNTLASGELQLQERKAMSFFATPMHVGTGDKWWIEKDDDPPRIHQGCFRPARTYNAGMSLGTAVTISGAAASPNMGYHSSPSLGVLMTMFNVRLGMWAGNPGPEGQDTFARPGPRPAFIPLYREALGLTTADDSYVYLSDGGHFENLGAYEMIRRGCKFILVSDAGCDPQYGYEDLGNLVRRVSIDFGVRIKFRPPLAASGKSSPHKGECCALADVYYPASDAERQAIEDTSDPEIRSDLEERLHGLMLYIKPGMYGSEPTSVLAYFNDHPEFPHESTTNQWFGETQFEAYRALGAFVTSEALDGIRTGKSTEIADLFAAFDDRYPR